MKDTVGAPSTHAATDVNLYSVGVCYASACAHPDATREDVERIANEAHPTGVGLWRIADENFSDGSSNPHACEDDQRRQHWLLVC